MAATQLEAVLFRLGLLGILMPRRRGEDIELVPGHIVWKALTGVADLRWRVLEEVRRRVVALEVLPVYLALSGSVADGTAVNPADLLELIVVSPTHAPHDWQDQLDGLVAQLSLDLGNVVTVYLAESKAAASELAGPGSIVVDLPGVAQQGAP
ncbi:hypothetical protein ACSYGO_07365 [Streptomyces krungchingensis]